MTQAEKLEALVHPNYPGYVIYRSGYVYSVKSKKYLVFQINNRGYYMVDLFVGGKKHRKTVHRLVAELYLANPYKKPEVNHKDGDKSHNFESNLEWSTRKENGAHAYAKGLLKRPPSRSGEQVIGHKLSWDQVREIRDLHSLGTNNLMLGKKFGVHHSTISRIVNGHKWKEQPHAAI